MGLRILFFICIIHNTVIAQTVHNDNIENRHRLQLNDKPYISHTENCTVQKECLNLKLTDQCLIFHNDQWFEFQTESEGAYYLSIRNQDCRDVRGTQAVIIDGTPCIPESYRILACVSNGHQDDMFVELSLEANKTYLLIIDGYLHDYCYFDIDISTTPPDFALINNENTESDTIISENAYISFNWLMDTLDAQNMQNYQILRRYQAEKKSSVIWESPSLRNARGIPFLEYQHIDTLDENQSGEYHYKVLGIEQDSSLYFIQDILVIYESKPTYYDPSDDYILVKLPKTKRGNLYRITLRDKDSEILLEKKSFQYDKLFDEIKLDISAYRKRNILNYEVTIENAAEGIAEIIEVNKPQPYIKKKSVPELF